MFLFHSYTIPSLFFRSAYSLFFSESYVSKWMSVQSPSSALQCRPKPACRISHVTKHLICNNATLPGTVVFQTHLCISKKLNLHYKGIYPAKALNIIFHLSLFSAIEQERKGDATPWPKRQEEDKAQNMLFWYGRYYNSYFCLKGAIAPCDAL